MRDVSWELRAFISKHGCLIFGTLNLLQKSCIVIGFGLDWQSTLKSGCGFGLSITFL